MNAQPGATDFDLHGLVRVRLVDAGPREHAAVRRQLGPIEAPTTGDADITIRFVDTVPISGHLRGVGIDEGAFDDQGMVVLRSKHKSPARVRIPFERIGTEPIEIVSERGMVAVPQLIPIVNFAVLAHGAVPLHAAAFIHEGIGVAACGWSMGGKTETLLSFMRQGARYVGDEWVYVTGDGATLHGIPEPIRLWGWHLEQLPEHRRRVPPRDRLKLGAIGALEKAHRAVPSRFRRRLPGMQSADRLMTLLEAQRHIDPPPERLFGFDRWASAAPFDRLLFLMNAEVPAIRVTPIDSLEVAERMTWSHVHHRIDFFDLYWQSRYAFPDRANPLIDAVAERERELLRTVFVGKVAFLVEHPHPVVIADLAPAIVPFLTGVGRPPAGATVSGSTHRGMPCLA